MRVVVMDKLHHSILLKEPSVDNKDEFRSVIPIVSATRARSYISGLTSVRIRLLADMFSSV